MKLEKKYRDMFYSYLNNHEDLWDEYVESVVQDRDSAESKNYQLNTIECYHDWILNQ